MTTNTCKEALTPPAQLPQPPTSCFRRRRKAGGGPAPAALRAERQSPLRRFPRGVTARSAERQPMQTDRTVNKGKKKSRGESKNQIPLMFSDVLSFYYQYWEKYVNSTGYLWASFQISELKVPIVPKRTLYVLFLFTLIT